MEFKKFNGEIQKNFKRMCETEALFTVTAVDLWDTYLGGFGDDPVFRDPESSEHNCNCCNNFIRRYGNIVAIGESLEIITLFSGIKNVGIYQQSADACDAYLKSLPIHSKFVETFDMLNSLPYERIKKTDTLFKLGIDVSFKRYTEEEVNKFGVVNSSVIYEFPHFHLFLPREFVDFTGASEASIIGRFREKRNVFARALRELPLDTLQLVLDLIVQGSLLDGTAHAQAVRDMIKYKVRFNKIKLSKKENWIWAEVPTLDDHTAKFKNTLIGVLCSELSEGVEINKACKNWNFRVDPVNYHKATAPITQNQINKAKVFVEENGYSNSFSRRLATIEDIKASEILHMNSGDGKLKEVSIFDKVKPTTSRHKRNQFENIEEVSITTFMSDILPNCSMVEAYLENRMLGNLAVLTTGTDPEAKRFTKWGGAAKNYSWTYNGNLAGVSQIKQAVKDAGGNVEGVLNFRLAWNDEKGDDASDLDVWAKEPNGERIGFQTPYRKDRPHQRRTPMTGQLDVDNMNPRGKLAVENITWTDLGKMGDGAYVVWVNQFDAIRSKGFQFEIECGGSTYRYEYDRPLKDKENIAVATVTLKNGVFSVEHALPLKGETTKELWGLETLKFHKVDLICKSPNHWAEHVKYGNLHYFFMLADCAAEGIVRGFHNENLRIALKDHRKVMEVLGATNMIEPKGKHLAGVGFNSTIKDELIVKCSGNFKRVLKIKF